MSSSGLAHQHNVQLGLRSPNVFYFAVAVRGDSVTECQCEISDTYQLKIVVEISAQDVIVSRDSEDCDISLFINFDSLCKLSSLLLYFKHVLIKKIYTDKVMSDSFQIKSG